MSQDELFVKIEQVGLRPSDVVKMSLEAISLNQASQWISAKGSRKLSQPVISMLHLMCKEKEGGRSIYEGLFSADYIIKSSVSAVSGITGIYFLLLNKEVVYVGQSVNVYARIAQHSYDKKFDSIFIHECEKENLTDLENLYIYSLKPKLNSVVIGGERGGYKRKESLKAIGNLGTVVKASDQKQNANVPKALPPQGGFIKSNGIVWFKYNNEVFHFTPDINDSAFLIDKHMVYALGDFTKLIGNISFNKTK